MDGEKETPSYRNEPRVQDFAATPGVHIHMSKKTGRRKVQLPYAEPKNVLLSSDRRKKDIKTITTQNAIHEIHSNNFIIRIFDTTEKLWLLKTH